MDATTFRLHAGQPKIVVGCFHPMDVKGLIMKKIVRMVQFFSLCLCQFENLISKITFKIFQNADEKKLILYWIFCYSESTYDAEFEHLMRGMEGLVKETVPKISWLKPAQLQALVRLERLQRFKCLSQNIQNNPVSCCHFLNSEILQWKFFFKPSFFALLIRFLCWINVWILGLQIRLDF